MFYWVMEVHHDGAVRIYKPAQDSIAEDKGVVYRLLCQSHNEAVSKLVLYLLNVTQYPEHMRPGDSVFNDDKPERW